MLDYSVYSHWLMISGIVIGVSVLLKILQKFFPNSKKVRPSLWIPGYKLVYTDQKNDRHTEGIEYSTLLVSEKYQLQGKPDFIYANKRGSLVPIELKSGTVGDAPIPYEKDLLQLAAYFLIIEDVYATRPKYGRLIYSDHMFIIKNNHRLRNKLLSTLSDMRDMLKTGEQESLPGYAKCKHCICRGTVCEYCDP